MRNLVPDQGDPRILTTKDVILSSHVALHPGRLPVRVVLRHQVGEPQEYVVHTETLEVSRRPEDEPKSIALLHRSFENGDYFSDLLKARKRFEERTGRL